jgi:hypothetical protein
VVEALIPTPLPDETILALVAYLSAANRIAMRELLRESLSLWRSAALSGGDARDAAGGNVEDALHLPPFHRTFTPAEQAAREIHLDGLLHTVEAELRDLPHTRLERRSARNRVTRAFTDFAKSCLDFDDAHLELLLNDGFSAVATQLARQAREFDPTVSAADIFQASRNAWTACGFQVLMGRDMRLTPSIFAYSMLYPYTDNYLDDSAISRGAKLAFSERFRTRLDGDGVTPFNNREATIWRLVELIEDQYARADWPDVYASLMAIHGAQENSVRLLRSGSSSAGADVLKLSFEKGGASVLADAYLVAGSLSRDEAQFAFDWGVLLQLADDLQDLQQDLREGIVTIFTQAAGRVSLGARLDALTSHTLNFGDRVMRQVDRMPSNNSAHPGAAAKHKSLTEMIRMSCSLLLIWSAGESSKLYTADYLAELETHSPFRFAPLREKRKKLARWTGPLARLFESFLEDEENDPASLILASSLMPRF